MAKNWTIAEAIAAYSNNDKNAITDIGKRFPLIADLISRVVSGDKEATMKLFGLLPEYNTLNRLNTAAKEDLTDEDAETEEEETEVEEKKPAKKAKKSEPEEDEEEDVEDSDDVDYEKLTVQQLINLGKKRGVKFKVYRKTEMIEELKAADAGDVDDTDAEEKDDGNDYEDMTPQELYKECKKRGIKTEPKQKASVYVKLLKADDAKAEEAEEDDDWGEGEEEEVEEKKPAKKVDKKAEKKTEKKAPKKDEDDDDDWDI